MRYIVSGLILPRGSAIYPPALMDHADILLDGRTRTFPTFAQTVHRVFLIAVIVTLLYCYLMHMYQRGVLDGDPCSRRHLTQGRI